MDVAFFLEKVLTKTVSSQTEKLFVDSAKLTSLCEEKNEMIAVVQRMKTSVRLLLSIVTKEVQKTNNDMIEILKLKIEEKLSDG